MPNFENTPLKISLKAFLVFFVEKEIIGSVLISCLLDAVFPYLKRVIVLLLLLSSFRQYIQLAQQETHSSIELIYSLGAVFGALGIYTLILPAVLLVRVKHHRKLRKLVRAGARQFSDISRGNYRLIHSAVVLIFSFLIGNILLFFFVDYLFAISLLLVLVVISFLNRYALASGQSNVFNTKFFTQDAMLYFGFAGYVTLVCLVIYAFGGSFNLEISSLFIGILAPRILIRHLLEHLRTLQ